MTPGKLLLGLLFLSASSACGRTGLVVSPDGAVPDVGSSGCRRDSECGDGDGCTYDRCDLASGRCVWAPSCSRACPMSPECGCWEKELDCTGGTDEDCDGATDCDDRDCDEEPPCTMACDDEEYDCFNGYDDDCDGLADCLDGSCRDAHAECMGCAGSEYDCFNGRDDDCNGLTDCDDFACEWACPTPCEPYETQCFNGRDDDCNGLADCTDEWCRRSYPEECSTGCVSNESDCWNGVDDDCDGAMDCADEWCMASYPEECGSVCYEREVSCSNWHDDDCDGAVDCADGDCSWDPSCMGPCLSSETSCGDGADNDCDGAIDCSDADCTMWPGCIPGACPEVDIGTAVGAPVATGSTTTGTRFYAGSCGGEGAPEHTFRWTAPATGTYAFDTRGSTFDTLLYVRHSSCDGGELVCNDDGISGTTQSYVEVSVTRGTVLAVFLDGWGSSMGSFLLNIRLTEAGACADMADNDGDGLADCADSDCATDPACTPICEYWESRCTDGRDNDCDGALDCRDSDCAASRECCVMRREICGNGRDDNCNRLVDCDEETCAGTPDCRMACAEHELGPSQCSDGADNDCDRRADCADTDCSPFGSHGECCNGVDDDGDGQTDIFTCRCFSEADCAGVGSLEQTCWTTDFHVCAPRCNYYGGNDYCRLFDSSRVCNATTGECVRPSGTTPPAPPPA